MAARGADIDPELRAAARMMQPLNLLSSAWGFRLMQRLLRMRGTGIKDTSLHFSERWIPRPDGTQLRICIFRPRTPQPGVPGVLWLHGGGYAIGVPEQELPMAKRLIELSNCVVVAPDYRLSVEAPYPAALDDCYTALLWLKAHASELGIRPDQLIVGGDSAGGGLTAALTLYARDKGEVAVAFQMPLYPMIDDRMTSDSARDNHAPIWNTKSNRAGWQLYLGDLYGSAHVPAYAAPARAVDYRHLPPTITFVGELEPFRDETVQYVENLRAAGVPVHFARYPGCYHAFEQISPSARVSQEAVAFLLDAYQYAVAHYFAAQNRPAPDIAR
jgi:acetyl esterase/lipase